MKRRIRLKRKNRVKLKRVLVLAVIAAVIALFIRTDRAVRPVAAMQAEHFAEITANEIIESAVSEYLEENRFTYSDFAAVLYDEKGNTVSVESIPYNINKVQSEIGLLINENLKKNGKKYTEIPLGSLTNSYLLTGKGPHLRLRVCPVGAAETRLKSDFSSAGINQTRHRISAVISVKMTSSVPLYSFDKELSFEFLLAENILMGNVPDLTPYTLNTGYNS